MDHPKVRDSSGLRNLLFETMPFLLSAVIVFYLYVGLGNGHMFNEDYAVYLQQAWNIAHHVPMINMGVGQCYT